MFNLLSTANPKTQKGASKGYLTFILHLAPYTLSGLGNVCPKASAGCIAACLNTAGRGGMFKKGETTNRIQQARIRKTRMFFQDKPGFFEALHADIKKAIAYASKKGLTPVFRLNGTSDLSWEKYGFSINGKEYTNVFDAFPNVQFYDYTAVMGRKIGGISNYSLTFSAKENNDSDIEKAIKQGLNIAMVFNKLPDNYLGLPVINGDETDLRFLDSKGVIVGLKAKGKAKHDNSGFVRIIE